MIDVYNEVFSTVAAEVRRKHPDAYLIGENIRNPSQFPCVTLDETENIMVDELIDSSHEEDYGAVEYRLQVFSNKQGGKRAEARAIFAVADAAMRGMGFRRTTYTTTPEIYNSTIYSINATYEGVVSTAGYTYKRQGG